VSTDLVLNLLSSCFVPSLTAIDLSHNTLSPEVLVRLLSCHGLPWLDAIGWGRNALADEGARDLASQVTLGGIKRLNLSANLITDRGALSLWRADSASSLSALDLSENLLSDECLHALSAARAPLQHLDLSYNSMISDEGVARLDPPPSLRWLNLKYTGASGAGVERLRARHPQLHVEWWL
jgi:Ran GTPase-activating protein (RanGAP) involved in mRNA processing and transport